MERRSRRLGGLSQEFVDWTDVRRYGRGSYQQRWCFEVSVRVWTLNAAD